jgi:ESX secretion-associated protein EspD/H
VNRSNHGGDDFADLDFGDEAGYDSGMDDLDFGDETGYDSGTTADLDFGDEPAARVTETSAMDALPEDAVDTEGTAAEEDEFSWERTTVTNPLETVSVTALMDGKTDTVELSPGAASMTESELAAEVLVIADLASQRATSVLHTLLADSMQAQGLEGGGTMADVLGSRFLGLTPPEQAAEAQAEVFAARYPNHPAQ